MSDGWQPINTAPRDGTTVKIKVDIESVQAYWEPSLDRWVLTRPLHMESVFRPTSWKPAHPKLENVSQETVADIVFRDVLRERGIDVNEHHLKTWPDYFEALLDGSKTFELRNNDRGFQVGDILVLEEFRPGVGEYTGRTLRKRVTYVMESGITAENDVLRAGYVALGLGEP